VDVTCIDDTLSPAELQLLLRTSRFASSEAQAADLRHHVLVRVVGALGLLASAVVIWDVGLLVVS
jgi:hypothetical protein